MPKFMASLLVVCLAVPVSAMAESERALTLKTAVERTLQQNPQLHQFSFTRNKVLGERDTQNLSPAYELGMDVENFSGTGTTSGLDSAEITVALSSVIEMGGKRQSRVAVVDARLEQLEIEKQVKTLDLLGEMTNVFIQLLTTQEEIALSNEAVALSTALYNTVKDRAARGAASDAEVIRAKAMLSQARLRHQSMEKKFNRQKVSLARYWGDTTMLPAKVQGDLFAFDKPQAFDTLFEKMKNNPAITVFASEMRLKDAQVKLADTQNQTDLGWQFGVRQFQETDDTALVIGVSVPLFSGSRNKGAARAVLAERNAVAYKRADKLLVLHDRLYSAYSQHEQAMITFHQLDGQIIPDLNKAMEITRQAYDRGRLGYQDWIAAQQELLSARQQLIETASSILLSQVVIEQLTAEPLTN